MRLVGDIDVCRPGDPAADAVAAAGPYAQRRYSPGREAISGRAAAVEVDEAGNVRGPCRRAFDVAEGHFGAARVPDEVDLVVAGLRLNGSDNLVQASPDVLPGFDAKRRVVVDGVDVVGRVAVALESLRLRLELGC